MTAMGTTVVGSLLKRMGLSRQVAWGMLGCTAMNLLASFCFKECATDADRTWIYFIAGNIFGPLSLIFLMWVYAGMNANLAAALTMGLGSVSVQIAFAIVYHVHLTWLQWGGIILAIIGGIVAVWETPDDRSTTSGGMLEESHG